MSMSDANLAIVIIALSIRRNVEVEEKQLRRCAPPNNCPRYLLKSIKIDAEEHYFSRTVAYKL